MPDSSFEEPNERVEVAWASIVREEEFLSVFGGSCPVSGAWVGLSFI